MDDLKCPICHSDSYLNPDIKIYISPCYHKICESCLSRIFSAGQSPCPVCGQILRKINYTTQTFENIEIEKECKIRKKLQRVFYLKKSDFKNDMEYNDYLEEFEDKVYEALENENIINEIEIQYGQTSKINHNYDRLLEKGTKIPNKPSNKEEIIQKTINNEFDPLKDVDILSITITKNYLLPKHLKINFLPGGFTEGLMVFKSILSLMDEDI